MVEVSAAPLALEAFPGLTRALCTQKDNAHCVPRSGDPHIPPFSKSARCLSSEAVWGDKTHRQLDWVDEALLIWHWWKMISVDVTSRLVLLLGQKLPVCVRCCVSSCLCLQLEGWELSFKCL